MPRIAVRLEIEGAVEALIAACADGPAAAEVRSVRRSPAEDPGGEDFEERATL